MYIRMCKAHFSNFDPQLLQQNLFTTFLSFSF